MLQKIFLIGEIINIFFSINVHFNIGQAHGYMQLCASLGRPVYQQLQMLVVTIITVVTIIITDKKKVSKKEKVGKE